MNSRLIFGREPAAWLGLIEAVLVGLMAFSLGVSQTTFGPIMAVVVALFALYTAWVTSETMLSVIVGLSKSALVLGAVYGLTLTDSQTGAIIGLVTIVAGFVNRDRTAAPVPAPLPVTV